MKGKTDVVQVKDVASTANEANPKLKEGWMLNDCMQECSYFPELLVNMAGTGEETGMMEGITLTRR